MYRFVYFFQALRQARKSLKFHTPEHIYTHCLAINNKEQNLKANTAFKFKKLTRVKETINV